MSCRLPYAAPTVERGRARNRHRRIARDALVLARGGSATVILTPADAKDAGVFASRCARAWNQMISEAEERHRRFWEQREGPGA